MSSQILIPQEIRTYLDTLTDEERDRVISATHFKTGGGYRKGHPGRKAGSEERIYTKTIRRAVVGEGYRMGPREVVAAREVREMVTWPDEPAEPTTGCLIDHAKAGSTTEHYSTVGARFDNFYKTHGERAIIEIKRYAARMNRVELPNEVEVEQWSTAEV